MNIKKISIAILLIPVLMLSCINNSNDDTGSSLLDPDPVSGDIILPTPEENLFIIANIDGSIIGFDSTKPTEYSILAENACTDEFYSEIRISPDLNYLLFAKNNETSKDLVLKNLTSSDESIIASNIASNESEFIDNNRIYYGDGGHIYVYKIDSMSSYNLIPHQTDRCNHWPQISPNLEKIVYKDQDPTPVLQNYALTTWSPVNFGTSSYECYDILDYLALNSEDYVNLYDSFEYNWRDDDTIIFKPVPGKTNKLLEKNVGSNAYLTNCDLIIESNICNFTKILISPDKNSLLLYGSNGVYLLDLTSIDRISGDLTPEQVYYSTELITQFGAFGSDSDSFVVATDKWVGVYNTAPIQKTSFSIASNFGDSAVVYSLYCR